MGNYIQRIFTSITKHENVRLAVFGLDAVGKTTMLYNLKLGEIVTTVPTIGMTVERMDYKGIHMISWDVGGRGQVRPLWRRCLEESGGINGLVYMIDSNDRDRMVESSDEFYKLLHDEKMIPPSCPVLLIANKQDLPNALSLAEITAKFDLHAIRQRKWFISPACATSGDGLYEGLEWLTDTIANQTARDAVEVFVAGAQTSSAPKSN